MTYKVSKDHKRLKQLLDEGNKIVCFVDHVNTDIALAKLTGSGEYMKYIISDNRGLTYISMYPLSTWYNDFSDEKLYKEFERLKVQFIDPEYERNTFELDYIEGL